MNIPVMHLGTCEDCLTIQAVWPHPEKNLPIPKPSEWESFSTDCRICDGYVNWDETVPVTDYLKRGY